MCIHLHAVMDYLNTAEVLLDKLGILAAVAPYLDEAGPEEKGRLAIGLLGIVGDYAQQLSAVSDAFTQTLPRGPEGQP
jgi:hypothetical protein